MTHEGLCIQDIASGELEMKRSNVVGKIEKEIELLHSEDLLRLLDGIVHRLKESMKVHPYDWENLYGAGRGLWEEDAQAYVKQLREDR